ncbi:probable histone-arginine methyltransferase 1.3 [Actinidia eriantha]|uniref:probable histone-arginine methyltransferase 1.3 n=1 Tax=Actinidia eriantha TaxID=165200 RepID=UPI00258BC0A3|nr:probable histone-arginine methyltransferase 1.3 [Actinidia eriantha]
MDRVLEEFEKIAIPVFASVSSLELQSFDSTENPNRIRPFTVSLRTVQLFKRSPVESVCISEGTETSKVKSYSRGITIQFRKDEESRAFHCAFEQWKKEVVVQGSCSQNGTFPASNNKFDDKIAASSAKTCFHFYGQLTHQKNMLLDYVRTGTYYATIIENRADFAGRVVVDVGAGTCILSLFAAQAGAKHVYAVEASEMEEYPRKLIAGNPSLGQRITVVVKVKIEEGELPEKADILISEPMGISMKECWTPTLLQGIFLLPLSSFLELNIFRTFMFYLLF